MQWLRDGIITVEREKSDRTVRCYTQLSSQDVSSLQERSPRYQHNLMELAALWGITWHWEKVSFDHGADQKLGGRVGCWRWWMEAVIDIFPSVLDRTVPPVYVCTAQGQSPCLAFLGPKLLTVSCVSNPKILTKSKQYCTSCEPQRLDEVMIWQHEVFTKVLQHNQSWGRKLGETKLLKHWRTRSVGARVFLGKWHSWARSPFFWSNLASPDLFKTYLYIFRSIFKPSWLQCQV